MFISKRQWEKVNEQLSFLQKQIVELKKIVRQKKGEKYNDYSKSRQSY